MKLHYRFLFLIIPVFVLGGCKKDLGNYDYTVIDSVYINGIEPEYVVSSSEQMALRPEITFMSQKTFNPEDFTYQWYAYKDIYPPTDRIEVHNGKDLDIQLPLNVGSYNFFYVVTEKKTSISWSKQFRVRIASTYNGGWMFLYERDNKSVLDFFEWDHSALAYAKIYRNFQEEIKNPETGEKIPLNGKPKFLASWYNAPEALSNSALQFIYVGTDENTEKINMTEGAIWTDRYSFKWETSNPPGFEKIDHLYPIEESNGYAVKGFDVFARFRTANVPFAVPINRLADGSHFRVSPYLAVGPGCVMYDIDHQRFVRNSGGSRSSQSPLPYDPLNSAFDPNDVGMDLLWMNQTRAFGGQAYAILTKDGEFWLARMDNSAVGFSASALDNISHLPEIDRATFFEVDQQYGYLQYVVDGKIYQYDPSDKKTTLMKDFGNRRISLFKYNRGSQISESTVLNNPDNYGKRFESLLWGLICATYDPASPQESGRVEIFKVPQFNASFETLRTFDGFGKVVGAAEAEYPLGW